MPSFGAFFVFQKFIIAEIQLYIAAFCFFIAETRNHLAKKAIYLAKPAKKIFSQTIIFHTKKESIR
jgi:hypothetical protein